MTVISATGTVTVVSDSGVEAQAIVVSSTPPKNPRKHAGCRDGLPE